MPPIAPIKNHNLTEDEIISIFRRGFEGNYLVRATKGKRTSFELKKSAWTKVIFSYTKKEHHIFLFYGPTANGWMLKLLLLLFIPMYIYLASTTWKKMMDEIERFIENDPRLNGN